MTNGAADAIFIDTNVLVYANALRAPLHQIAYQRVNELVRSTVNVWISRQIMREYLATLSRIQTFGPPHSPADLAADIRFFRGAFLIAEDDWRVTERLLLLMQQVPVGGKQIHDANIVATMLVYGVQRLLTNNVADFNRYSGLITIVPLQ
jgi:predicted nucleic acid-binding protein